MELQTVSSPPAAPTAEAGGSGGFAEPLWRRQERYAQERAQLEGEMHVLVREEARYRLELDDAVAASRILGEEVGTLEARLRGRATSEGAAWTDARHADARHADAMTEWCDSRVLL